MVNFVLGGSGFIGQRLVSALKQLGGEIRVLSRKKQSDYDTIVCDLQSEVIPDQALNNVNTVFHLAGFTQYGT